MEHAASKDTHHALHSSDANKRSPTDRETEHFFYQLRQRDFPVLRENVREKPLIYLDSAATSLKPKPVIDTLHEFYLYHYGTVHRALYSQALFATEEYNKARNAIAAFIHAFSSDEVVFTRGTTDSINIIADALVHTSGLLHSKKTILTTAMEHHANLVPWQMASERSGAALKIVPLIGDLLDLDALQTLLSMYDVAVVAVTHVSNILGTVNPIKKIAALCKEHGALLLVDGAQAAAHMKVDVQDIGCDFYAFSSHKMAGPTGAGVLWARKELLQMLNPPRGGGDMIDKVTFEKTTYAEPPLKFEPGTPPIAEVIGMARAVEYLQHECGGIEKIFAWESELTRHLREGLLSLGPRVRLIGDEQEMRAALHSFAIEGAHPLDIATLLDLERVAIRSGHMCGQPLISLIGHSSLLRASCAFYNTKNDIDLFVQALAKVMRMV